MTAILKPLVILLSCFTASMVVTACLNSAPVTMNRSGEVVKTTRPVQKPGSSFTDTLTIDGPVAVFYTPDFVQLEKIREVTDSQLYNGSMHDYMFQIRNAHIFLRKYWPHLKIVEVRDARYLLFHKTDGSTELIDLDRQDPCGMFLFDGKNKKPQLVDMTNIDSQVPDYFGK